MPLILFICFFMYSFFLFLFNPYFFSLFPFPVLVYSFIHKDISIFIFLLLLFYPPLYLSPVMCITSFFLLPHFFIFLPSSHISFFRSPFHLSFSPFFSSPPFLPFHLYFSHYLSFVICISFSFFRPFCFFTFFSTLFNFSPRFIFPSFSPFHRFFLFPLFNFRFLPSYIFLSFSSPFHLSFLLSSFHLYSSFLFPSFLSFFLPLLPPPVVIKGSILFVTAACKPDPDLSLIWDTAPSSHPGVTSAMVGWCVLDHAL